MCGFPRVIIDPNRLLWSMYSILQACVLHCVCATQSQLAASSNCLVIGWRLSGGDGLWCWCIYLLYADRKLFLRPDWLGLITAASVALFNSVRLGRVCLLTRWDVHEDERKTFSNLGWHCCLGKHNSSLQMGGYQATRPLRQSLLSWHVDEHEMFRICDHFHFL